MATVNKEIAKLLQPRHYDGKSVIDSKRFLSQLELYLGYNTALNSAALKIQVTFGFLEGEAAEWATPYQVDYAAGRTPFANFAAFTAAFTARFGNIDDAAAAQVELTKVCSKNLRDTRTAAEFSAQFKGPADRSGYGDLELRDKYLSGIPSRIYRKIELETFATWSEAETRVLAVEQILDISRARRPDLNMFARGGARSQQNRRQGASATVNAAVGDGTFPGSCYGCGKQGYRRSECPDCKDKPYTRGQGGGRGGRGGRARAAAATAATAEAQPPAQVVQQAPGDLAATLASVSALAAEVKSMREELGNYRAMKESENF